MLVVAKGVDGLGADHSGADEVEEAEELAGGLAGGGHGGGLVGRSPESVGGSAGA